MAMPMGMNVTESRLHWLRIFYCIKLRRILSPPATTLSSDVTMHAVHFWGQERSYLPVFIESPLHDVFVYKAGAFTYFFRN